MGKYQKNIEAARRITVMNSLQAQAAELAMPIVTSL